MFNRYTKIKTENFMLKSIKEEFEAQDIKESRLKTNKKLAKTY